METIDYANTARPRSSRLAIIALTSSVCSGFVGAVMSYTYLVIVPVNIVRLIKINIAVVVCPMVLSALLNILGIYHLWRLKGKQKGLWMGYLGLFISIAYMSALFAP